MSFDPRKPARTKCGFPVRILCADAKNNGRPIIALVTKDGFEHPIAYEENGSYYVDGNGGGWDLENIPEETHGYVNVYKDGCGMIHEDLDLALARAHLRDINELKATIKITYINGDISGVELA